MLLDLQSGWHRKQGQGHWNVLRRPEDRRERAAELFGRVRSGALTVQVAGRFALSDGASAHRLLESRQSSGKVLLIPDHQR